MIGRVSGVPESPAEKQFLISPARLCSFRNCPQPCKARPIGHKVKSVGEESGPTGLALNFQVLKVAAVSTHQPREEGPGEVGRK